MLGLDDSRSGLIKRVWKLMDSMKGTLTLDWIALRMFVCLMLCFNSRG